jgi:hypothetical protein
MKLRIRNVICFAFVLSMQLPGLECRALLAAAAEARPKISAVRVGIAGHYKVGCWTPIWVETEAAENLADAHIAVTVVDSDAVATTASAPLQTTARAGGRPTTVIYTKVGRISATIHVAMLDGKKSLDELTLRPGHLESQESSALPLPSTAELVVGLGVVPGGLSAAFPNRQGEGVQLARRTVEITNVDALPTQWYGYEGVDVLLVSAGDGKIGEALAADQTRFAALLRWIELGGRVVVMCDGAAAENMLTGGSLAKLAPGKLAEVVRLTDTGPLEHFSGSATQISSSDVVNVPRFTETTGSIEAHGGRQPTDLPLVVRTPRGLGEMTFVGVDVSQPPLNTWPGRNAFLQSLLRPYLPDTSTNVVSQRLVSRGYDDLSGALRQRLGHSFSSVVLIGFPLVAVAAVAYMLVLGPVDYLIVHRWMRKPAVAWITFPLIVLLFGVGAAAIAEWRRGSGGVRVNQLELVDVDAVIGAARGTFWASLYSPRAARFDLAMDVPESLIATPSEQQRSEALLSWWGLPGTGIGGMHAAGAESGIIGSGYEYGPHRNSLKDVPILPAATKSYLARWAAPARRVVTAELNDQDGLLGGYVVNEAGRTLENVRLLYGTWAYRLGTLGAGQRFDIGGELSPRQVKTIVTREALGDATSQPGESNNTAFNVDQASAKELLSLMMFYDAAGGIAFAQLPSRFQAYCDLSRQLVLGRAILVADAPGPSSQLVDSSTGRPIVDDTASSTTIYRVILPVDKTAANGTQ